MFAIDLFRSALDILTALPVSAFAAAVLAWSPARGDEGMWMPQQMPELAGRLRALGYEGDPKAFADLTGFPMGAIVSLGGCSASFVSPDGLIVTNHHCVQAALQFNSRPDRNLMVDGFLAAGRADELPSGPGSRVFVTVAVEDVTAAVTGNGTISFGLANTDWDGVYYDSRESGANGPRLIVTSGAVTTPDQTVWAAGDIVENRPPLSRWHKDFGDAFASFVRRGSQ